MIDIQKTRRYYRYLDKKEVCNCAYCLNYIKQIEFKYPRLGEYLKSIGIDITKPFETMPVEVDSQGNIEYAIVQYIAFGDEKDFKKTDIPDVTIEVAHSHPSTNIQDKHFVIEIYPIVLKWII
ncbi:MAG: hypothetical protein Q4G61_10310 [Tissierellia bacterium]|nr:hypothetical protein [Tissierellia bacterium]